MTKRWLHNFLKSYAIDYGESFEDQFGLDSNWRDYLYYMVGRTRNKEYYERMKTVQAEDKYWSKWIVFEVYPSWEHQAEGLVDLDRKTIEQHVDLNYELMADYFFDVSTQMEKLLLFIEEHDITSDYPTYNYIEFKNERKFLGEHVGGLSFDIEEDGMYTILVDADLYVNNRYETNALQSLKKGDTIYLA